MIQLPRHIPIAVQFTPQKVGIIAGMALTFIGNRIGQWANNELVDIISSSSCFKGDLHWKNVVSKREHIDCVLKSTDTKAKTSFQSLFYFGSPIPPLGALLVIDIKQTDLLGKILVQNGVQPIGFERSLVLMRPKILEAALKAGNFDVNDSEGLEGNYKPLETVLFLEEYEPVRDPIAKILIENGAEIVGRSRRAILSCPLALKAAIKAGKYDVNDRTGLNYLTPLDTILHHNELKIRREVAKILINSGAEVKGNTKYHLLKCASALEAAIKAGKYDVNAQIDFPLFYTPLSAVLSFDCLAVERRQVVEVLMKHGAIVTEEIRQAAKKARITL